MSIDLTAAIEAAAHMQDDHLWTAAAYDDLTFKSQTRRREVAAQFVVAAFPLVRDAIADAIDAINFHDAMTEKQDAYDCGLDEAARLVRGLTVTE